MPSVFDEVPEVGYSYTDELPVSIRRDGGPYEESRTKLAPIARRRYSWKLRRDDCVGFLRTDVDDFLAQLRSLQFESFYLKDPRDALRSGVSLGVGDGATQTFSWPSVGTESRDYPIDSAAMVVYVSGSPVTVSSVDTDARTVTLAAPPGLGLAVTTDYEHYKLCRVDGEFTWTGQSSTSYETAVGVVEVLA